MKDISLWNGDCMEWMSVKYQPLRAHENIGIFYKNTCIYYPQKESGCLSRKHSKYKSGRETGSLYGEENRDTYYESTERYPRDVIYFNNSKRSSAASAVNRTRKPLDLYKYLILTYTNEDDLVLDAFAGSMTCAYACLETGRRCICIEKDESQFEAASKDILEKMENNPDYAWYDAEVLS